MNHLDKVKNALGIIQKNGDVYDVVARALNNRPTSNGLFRYNVLMFSRILYAGILLKDKLLAPFAPVEKVREAQEEIREVLGFNVDVLLDKSLNNSFRNVLRIKKNVAILYEAGDIYRDEYTHNIERLLSFCHLYDIDTIYLSLKDLNRILPSMNTSSFTPVSRTTIFGVNQSIDVKEFLLLNRTELSSILMLLNNYEFDKKYITALVERINDQALKGALDSYNKDGNLESFKRTILARLSLELNSEGGYKTKNNGKTYDTVSIEGEFVKIISYSQNNANPEVCVMNIWEYLGFANYDALLKSLENSQDDEQKIIMACLYLYLNDNKSFSKEKTIKVESYYDKVYKEYLEYKKDYSKKNSPYFASKPRKVFHNFITSCYAIYLSLLVVCGAYSAVAVTDIIRGDFSARNAKNGLEYIANFYQESYEFEKSLLLDAKDVFADVISGALDITGGTIGSFASAITGDAPNLGEDNDKVVAEVYPRNDEVALPRYYACGYATSSEYKKGQITYDMESLALSNTHIFSDKASDFYIKTNISRKELKSFIKDDSTLDLPIVFYPVDFNCFLTEIIIDDAKDSSKGIVIVNEDKPLNKEQIDTLLSLKKPQVYYYFATDNWVYINSFVDAYYPILIDREGRYLDTPSYEMKQIISESLGLGEDAYVMDIFRAIKNKDYSLTPIKDAKLTSKVKKMDEKEYIKTIASLDSLVCNLAATLAVEADDTLVYVTGFLADNDVGQLTLKASDAHAWGMDDFGFIYDATPQDLIQPEEEKESSGIVNKIISATFQSLVLGTIGICLYYLGGKRLIFIVNKKQISNLLNSNQMGEAYSLINELRFGGINIPVQRDTLESLQLVANDFEGYTKGELQELLESLKKMQNPEAKLAIKVIKRVPYIKRNEQRLIRSLKEDKENA